MAGQRFGTAFLFGRHWRRSGNHGLASPLGCLSRRFTGSKARWRRREAQRENAGRVRVRRMEFPFCGGVQNWEWVNSATPRPQKRGTRGHPLMLGLSDLGPGPIAMAQDARPSPTRLAARMMIIIPAQRRRMGLPLMPCHSPSARPTRPAKRT